MNRKTLIALVVILALLLAVWIVQRTSHRRSLEAPAQVALSTALSADEIGRVEIAGPGAEPLVLDRSSGGWRVASSWGHPADAGKIDELTAELAALRGEFRSDEAGVLADYRLDEDQAIRLSLFDRRGAGIETLLLGSPLERGAGLFLRREGENAVYAMTPIVQAVARLNREMDSEHPLLGRGSLAVTSISSEAPSLTALPDRCLIHVDRRITLGEDRELVLRQLSELPEVAAAKAEVRLLRWESPSWRDLVYPTDMFFPAWETPADGAVVLASVEAARQVLGREPRFHRSAFSSNACATAGMFSIPTVGFGPADEIHSHSNLDQVPLAQLVPAMAFYATLPLTYARHVGRS